MMVHEIRGITIKRAPWALTTDIWRYSLDLIIFDLWLLINNIAMNLCLADVAHMTLLYRDATARGRGAAGVSRAPANGS